MLRRIACVAGLALLATTAVAVPAQAEKDCPDVDGSPSGDTDKPKSIVVADMDGEHVIVDDGDPDDVDGDPDGQGTITLTFLDQYKNEEGEKVADVSFDLVTNFIDTPLRGAHIKRKPVEEDSDFMLIAIEFFTFNDDRDRSGVVTISKCLAHKIFNQPENYYADVHNDVYTQGAIRGPLVKSS